MSKLKGNSNVVSYENHQVIEHKDGIGWDILIQMELLTPLNEYIRTTSVTRQDIIKLGIDMCKALELCQKFNIIHRDVKPENIFVSESGDFKLGDFGIARTVEKTSSGLSKKGTYTYMAPEVYKGENYDSTVDIYSLGVVLYRLLNENRTPFLPAYPAPITHSDRENALAKRFSGAPLPPPIHAEGRLAEIVLKACDYAPRQRYNVPLRMRQELEAILYNREESRYIYPDGDEAPQHSVQYVRTGEVPPVSANEPTQRDDFAYAVQDRTVGQFEATVSDRTVGQFEATVTDPDRTVSDFGTVKEKPGKAKAQKTAPPKQAAAQPRKKGKALPIVLALVLAIGAAVGGFAFKSNKDAEQKREWNECIAASYNAYDQGFYDKSVSMILECMAENYDDMGEVHINQFNAILAASYFELGEYGKAADLYYDLQEADSAAYGLLDKVSCMRDYAVCLARQNRLDEAAAVLVMLTNSGVETAVANYVLGETYYAKDEYENAAKVVRQALAETQDTDLQRRCYLTLAETYRELRDYSASVELLEEALKRSDLMTNAAMYEMLGDAYFQRALDIETSPDPQQDYLNSAMNFESAIRSGMRKTYLYVNAAIGYLNGGWYDEAFQVLDDMEQVYPNQYEVNAMRGIIHINQQNNLEQNQRDYAYAYEQYLIARDKATSNDDQRHLQMLESYIDELERLGWL